MVDIQEDPFVPGNKDVSTARLNTGYFCAKCRKYIKPIIIRIGDKHYPSCEDCFLNDLTSSGKKLGDPLDTGIEVEEDELVGESELEPEDPKTEECCTGE
jgi:hypothetical protein